MKCLPLFLAALIAAGCSQKAPAASQAPSAPPASTSLANGRSIFLTGRDSSGKQIVAATRPLLPSCAGCHGAGGSGGFHLPGAVSADLRHKALVTEMEPPYTLALVERAISTGIDSAGERLNPVMPRWRLDRRDLHDVASYVMTLK